MASRDPRPVPEWKLERYCLGELPKAELDALDARVALDPELTEQVAALRRDDAEILKQIGTKDAIRRIEGQIRMAGIDASRARVHRRPALFAGLAAAAVAAALVVTWTRVDGDHGLPEIPGLSEDGIRLKGGAQLLIVRQRQGDSVALRSGESAAPGDLLQVSYRTSEPAFGAILSIDGAGSVTWHFPEGERAAALATNGIATLPRAYELDDAPQVERFFLVTGSTPFALAPVMDAAERFGRDPAVLADPHRSLALPPGLEQASFIVRKEGIR